MTELKIDTPTLKKHLGKKVKYWVKGYNENNEYFAHFGIIEDVINRQISFGSSDYRSFNYYSKVFLID